MKTMIALLLATTAAHAEFVLRKPPTAVNGDMYLECAVVRVTPPDHDRNPGYKVTLHPRTRRTRGEVTHNWHRDVWNRRKREKHLHPAAAMRLSDSPSPAYFGNAASCGTPSSLGATALAVISVIATVS
jgi:hypothetical protein